MKGVMDVDIFIRYMKENTRLLNGEELKVMGGEPTLHPRVIDLIHEAYYHFGKIKLFTNGSQMSKIAKDPRMIKTHFEGVTAYLINGHTFKPEKFHEYKDFVREIVLHCVVPLENVDDYINRVLRFLELGPQINICISPDTQINLFDDNIMEKYRESFMKAVTTLIPRLYISNQFFAFDHFFPTCFFTQDIIDTLHAYSITAWEKTGCCSEYILGLIDWNFDLHFCNQTRFKIGNVLDKDGNMLSLPEINEMIKTAPQMKCNNIRKLSEKCRNCSALPICKVGCYYNVLQ
jgi:radical SAM protein with 4Fe4S-binding SPASM domain